MLKTRLTTQGQISLRGYIEIRATLLTMIPLALLYGAVLMKAKRFPIVAGGLAFELLDFLDKVFFYSYKPAHYTAPERSQRHTGVRVTRELAYLLTLGSVCGHGGHRAVRS
jgi:hypothetical protein